MLIQSFVVTLTLTIAQKLKLESTKMLALKMSFANLSLRMSPLLVIRRNVKKLVVLTKFFLELETFNLLTGRFVGSFPRPYFNREMNILNLLLRMAS
jgi:hypothetical protein